MLEQGLRALLVDPDRLVRVRAAGLARHPRRSDHARGSSRRSTATADTVTQIAVAEALGRIGGPSVQPLLVRIVGEVGPQAAPIRAAALDAMAAPAATDFARILQFYMLNDADPGVRAALAETALVSTSLRRREGRPHRAARRRRTARVEGQARPLVLRALGMFDGPEVRESLGRCLEDKDVHVVDQAALGLARQTEGVAVPYLIAILRRPEEPLRPNALDALQELTSTTMLVQGYEANADQYEAWFRAHRQGGDRAWFRDALARRGYDATAPWPLRPGRRRPRGRAGAPQGPARRRRRRCARTPTSPCVGSRASRSGVVERKTPREDSVTIAEPLVGWWIRQPEAPR